MGFTPEQGNASVPPVSTAVENISFRSATCLFGILNTATKAAVSG
jgi:hypothetical protein